MAANRKLFVNLAVADLDRAVGFWSRLGFEFDPRFTDETATCMLIGEDAYAMLLVRDRFAGFLAGTEVADSRRVTEAILALTVDSREEADRLADEAFAAGASPARDPEDLGFMYGRSFHDPDGHLVELFHMDMAAFAAETAGEGAAA
jgi:predicted lactoylglutathione lyase